MISVPSEYDYIFELAKYRTQILEAICEGYTEEHEGNAKITVYFIDDENLNPYVTFSGEKRQTKIQESCEPMVILIF